MSRCMYDDEFKRDAVDRLLSSGKEMKPLAHNLGVSYWGPRKWRDRYLRERAPKNPRGGRRPQAQKLDALKTHKKALIQQLFPSPEAVQT